MPRKDQQVIASIKRAFDDEIKRLPKASELDANSPAAWEKMKGRNFVLSMPNPTTGLRRIKGISALRPQEFQAMNCQLVLWAPHLYWHGLCKIHCPKCLSPARVSPHQWSTSLRRINGLGCLQYVRGARYICKGCPGMLCK